MPTGTPIKLKKCAICGELFLPKTPSTRICDKDHITRCPICGKDIIWNSTRQVEPCSKECRKIRTKQNNIKKYGVEHPMQNQQVQEHHKQTMLDKYGVKSPLQSEEIKSKVRQTNREKFGSDWTLGSEQIRYKSEQTMIAKYGAATTLQSPELTKKVQSTMIDKYGAPNAMQVESIKQKARCTNLIKYGVENPMQNDEIISRSVEHRMEHITDITEKIRQTCLETYGVDNPFKDPEIIAKVKSTMHTRYGCLHPMICPEIKAKLIQTNIERYGVPYYCMTDDCKQKQGDIISSINRKFGEHLKDADIAYKFEHKIADKSYDIYLPDKNTLIEIDPTYTHNTVGNHWNKSGLDPQYHIEKSILAAEHGYHCIHVFDWDDWNKIINLLLPTESIYARRCEIYRLNSPVAVEFLNNYHIQGSCKGQLLCLGLVYNGELYQVMTFGKSRYDKHHDVELLRLCTKPGYTVVGGASKLFSYATNEFGLHNIISYCDLSKFTGDVYEKIGMNLLRKTPPQEIWSKGNKKITANLLRQRGYDQLFGTHYGKGVSNEQLMLEHGWLPVYDCGQKVFEYK